MKETNSSLELVCSSQALEKSMDVNPVDNNDVFSFPTILYLSPNRHAPVLAKNGHLSLSFPGMKVTMGLCHGPSPSFQKQKFYT